MRTRNYRRRIIPVLAATAAVFLLTGCLDMETEVIVTGDGSGKVRQYMLMRGEVVEMIGSMKGDENYSLLNEEELKAKAADMGEGVTFTGAEPMERNGFTGYVATYAFTNIEKLRLNENPTEDLPDEASGDDIVREMISFSFEEGRTNTLTINMPKHQFEKGQEKEAAVEESEMEEVIQGFQKLYNDMKISMRIIIDGRITKTNATYQDGNTITLMEIDFSHIAEDPEQIRALARANPETIEELKEFVTDIPALKGELQEVVEVSFR